MKIKFISHDDSPEKKKELCNTIKVVRSVSNDGNNKYYS